MSEEHQKLLDAALGVLHALDIEKEVYDDLPYRGLKYLSDTLVQLKQGRKQRLWSDLRDEYNTTVFQTAEGLAKLADLVQKKDG